MTRPARPPSVSDMVMTWREILRRRRWWLIFPAVLISALTVPIVLTLPPVYQSTTLIMVEAQKVPQEFVRTTVTSSIEDRLRSISQQILSRTRLERVIREFGLYQPKTEVPEGILGWWSRLQSPAPEPREQGGIPLSLVEHMQRNIDIKVRNGNTFSVSYQGGEPGTVMNVTNKLASLFIEENLKVREEQAEGTTEFLDNELQNIKARLEAQEEELRKFKEQHMGELPGQLDTNLRTLDRLQAERQRLQDALKNAEDRYAVLSQQLEDPLAGVERQVVPPSSARLQALRARLAALRTEYKDEYPDIVILKNEIAKLEAQVAEQPDPEPATGSAGGGNDYTAILAGELQGEIKSTKQRQQAIAEQIQHYEQRVERTFLREQQLTQITRDYENVRNTYQSLLDKRQSARIAESLERRQKGEIFRVLDPANYPTHPFKPDRTRLILLGFTLSLGVGFGLALLREHLDPSVQSEHDLLDAAPGVPVLAAVPFVTSNVVDRPTRQAAPVPAPAGKAGPS